MNLLRLLLYSIFIMPADKDDMYMHQPVFNPLASLPTLKPVLGLLRLPTLASGDVDMHSKTETEEFCVVVQIRASDGKANRVRVGAATCCGFTDNNLTRVFRLIPCQNG